LTWLAAHTSTIRLGTGIAILPLHNPLAACLWSTPASTYHGEFTSFDQAYSYPKPTASENFPVFYGGNGDLILRRVARNGHGWIAMNLRPEEAGPKIKTIRAHAEELGRDPQSIEMTMLTSNWPTYTADDLKRFHEVGMQELIALGHAGPRRRVE
jgi:alkanesulfonate monooxygenase SsuD/methylene tetrahydromethanopterin reductase-like flavin-dependent oxidoreductase (luciferase family)